MKAKELIKYRDLLIEYYPHHASVLVAEKGHIDHKKYAKNMDKLLQEIRRVDKMIKK